MNPPKYLLTLFVLLTTACAFPEPSVKGAARESVNDNTKVYDAGEDEAIYWVNSVRAECAGVAPTSCMQVQEGSTLRQNEWQLFYSSIEGFSYEVGYVYKLLVKKEQLPLDQVPADASSIKYTLVRQLEKTLDPKLRLNDIWGLERIQGGSVLLEIGIMRPRLEMQLRDMTLFGNDGCNDFFGRIEELNANAIVFGPIAGTRKYCQNMKLADHINLKMRQVSQYKIKDLTLYLLDSSGEELLVFRKMD